MSIFLKALWYVRTHGIDRLRWDDLAVQSVVTHQSIPCKETIKAINITNDLAGYVLTGMHKKG